MSLIVWLAFDVPFLFFLLPLVFPVFLWGRADRARACPACGREYADQEARYCMEDGAPLEPQGAKVPKNPP